MQEEGAYDKIVVFGKGIVEDVVLKELDLG
jgi:hypothetical protein